MHIHRFRLAQLLDSGHSPATLKAAATAPAAPLDQFRRLPPGLKQFTGTVPPLLIRRTAERFFEALGRNLDNAKAALKSRKLHHRLSLDRFQAGTKPARGAFQ